MKARETFGSSSREEGSRWSGGQCEKKGGDKGRGIGKGGWESRDGAGCNDSVCTGVWNLVEEFLI